ncbi:MAG: hydrogenase nickel incorporation protein HypB [Candidatus Thermoplasmatota archaeon]|nr:hydrogenase nickel incorporation protein HypB [Candidatus Thermoplasmatota archaeon]MBS3789709.1 hydrogenase nickel incorporation protein HypB [Candidatus Thermoplasmatota archaeon]
MHKTTEMDMEKNILEENERIAKKNEKLFEEKGVRAFNILGAIGSGKTSLIERLREGIDQRVGAVAGDLNGKDDYERFRQKDMSAVAINTGKDCHLDAHYVNHGLEDMDLDEIDLLFIENVGNLICPVDFPLGTEAEVVVVSVTEGDDMIRKHPLIFSRSDLTILNKVDLADAMEVDIETIKEDYKEVNPHGTLIKTNAKEGKGIEEVADFLDIPYSV